MIASATTTVTIYRGQTTDEWGDPIDLNNVVYTGIAASIIELNLSDETETSLVPRVIRTGICRVGSEIDVQQNDRIYDERNQESWIILSISKMQNPFCAMDTKISVQRVS